MLIPSVSHFPIFPFFLISAGGPCFQCFPVDNGPDSHFPIFPIFFDSHRIVDMMCGSVRMSMVKSRWISGPPSAGRRTDGGSVSKEN